MRRVCLALILLVLSGISIPARAQGGTVYDVFLNSNMNKGTPGLYFVDARTGLSSVVVTNGINHTLLDKGVLYQETDTGVVKIAFPDGRTIPHPAVQPSGAGGAINWVTSPDRKRIAWASSQMVGTSLLSDLFVAQADGSDKKLVLHTSSTKNIDTVPLALTDDGSTVFYSRQTTALRDYQLFPLAGDVFKLVVATGQSTQLPDDSKCACGVAVTPDGKRFARLEVGSDGTGHNLHLWDLGVNIATLVKEPGLSHTQAGFLLLSRDGNMAVYTSARGVPPAKGVPPERFVLILVDVPQREQRVLTEALPNKLRAIAFERNNSAILVAGVDKDGTYKLSVKDGTLLQVSPYTFLGTING